MTAVADAWLQRLPRHWTAADQAVPGTPLTKLVEVLATPLDDLATLIGRIDRRLGGHTDRASDLTDPAHADVAWLGWLGRAVGVIDDPALPEATRREMVANAQRGWRAGTPSALKVAAQAYLIGSKRVTVTVHVGGDPLAIDVSTYASETPDPAAVLAAVTDYRVKPAGRSITHTVLSGPTIAEVAAETTPDTLAGRQATFPTFADIHSYVP